MASDLYINEESTSEQRSATSDSFLGEIKASPQGSQTKSLLDVSNGNLETRRKTLQLWKIDYW